MSRFCMNCGAELDPATGTCPACGAIPADAAEPAPEPQPIPEPQPAPQTAPDPEPTPAAPAYAQESAPQYDPAPQYVEPQYAAPQYSAPQYAPEPQYAAPQYADPQQYAQQQQYAPMPQYAQAPQPKKKQTWKTILAILLLLLFMANFAAAAGLFIVREGLTSVDVGKIIDGLSEKALETMMNDNRESTDQFYGKITDGVDLRIDDEGMAEFLKESSLSDFLSEKISSFTGGMLDSGSGSLEITKNDVVDLVLDNADLIEEKFDKKVTREDAKKIADSMLNGEKKIKLIDLENTPEDAALAFGILRGVFSKGVMIAFAAAALVCAALMFILRPRFSSFAIGVILIFWGVPLALSSPVLGAIASVTGVEVVFDIIRGLLDSLKLYGVILSAVGVALIVLGIVLSVVKKRRRTA